MNPQHSWSCILFSKKKKSGEREKERERLFLLLDTVPLYKIQFHYKSKLIIPLYTCDYHVWLSVKAAVFKMSFIQPFYNLYSQIAFVCVKLTSSFTYLSGPYYNQDFKLAGIVQIRKRALYMYIINIRINYMYTTVHTIQYSIGWKLHMSYVWVRWIYKKIMNNISILSWTRKRRNI